MQTAWPCGSHGSVGWTQTFQNPLIKEYTLNYNRDPPLYFEVYSLIKGFWKVWGAVIITSPEKFPLRLLRAQIVYALAVVCI